MKILSAETNLGSATNVSNAPVVRLFNSGTDNILVTRKDYNAVVVGSFMVPSGEVVYAEKYYTDTLEGSADVKATKTAYSSMMSFVSSGSSGPTYTYSVSASSVDEGGNWTTTVTTTNVDDNTTLYWSLSGTNVTSADFSSGALTGSGTISNNTFNFSHTVANDTLTEGTETVDIKLFTDSGRNTQVGNTVSVTLNDTSLTPTYTPTISYTVRNEGDSFTTTMTTTNVANSTELWWELSGTGIAAGDFSSGALTGSGTISNNTFNFSHTIASDNTTEGEETLSIKFYSDSGRTTQVGATLTCTINDTSLTPPTTSYSVTFDGSGDWLTVGSGSTLQLGTGDFCIECWALFFDNGNRGAWQHPGLSTNYSSTLAFAHNGSSWHGYRGGSYWHTAGGRNANQWYHLAYVKHNNDMTAYVDGSSVASWSDSYDYTGQTLAIGGYYTTGYLMNGRISNFRMVKGSAVYTSSFTPPTAPLGNISGTVLLCCNGGSVTSATVGPTITINGNPVISSENPF